MNKVQGEAWKGDAARQDWVQLLPCNRICRGQSHQHWILSRIPDLQEEDQDMGGSDQEEDRPIYTIHRS